MDKGKRVVEMCSSFLQEHNGSLPSHTQRDKEGGGESVLEGRRVRERGRNREMERERALRERLSKVSLQGEEVLLGLSVTRGPLFSSLSSVQILRASCRPLYPPPENTHCSS